MSAPVGRGTPRAFLTSCMKHALSKLLHDEPGQRFCACYERHAQWRSGLTRVLSLLIALISFVVGIVLAFIPGPAILFFAITAGLMATQSLWVAKQLDAAEAGIRKYVGTWRERRAQRRRTRTES